MIKKLSYIVFITFLFISHNSCNIKGEIEDSNDELRCHKEVMTNADAECYAHLNNYYVNSENYQSILPFALKMLKENKNIGYNEFFITYLKISFNNQFNLEDILKLDLEEKNYLIYILNKGALKEDVFCKNVLIYYNLHGIVIEKDFQKADSIYKTFNYPNKKLDPNTFKID